MYLACPTVSLEPGPIVEEFPREIDGQPVDDYIEWLRFSFLSTTAGLPAISIPAGFTKSGLPVGLQLISPPRGEAKVLAAARAIELAVGGMKTPIDPIITHLVKKNFKIQIVYLNLIEPYFGVLIITGKYLWNIPK